MSTDLGCLFTYPFQRQVFFLNLILTVKAFIDEYCHELLNNISVKEQKQKQKYYKGKYKLYPNFLFVFLFEEVILRSLDGKGLILDIITTLRYFVKNHKHCIGSHSMFKHPPLQIDIQQTTLL